MAQELKSIEFVSQYSVTEEAEDENSVFRLGGTDQNLCEMRSRDIIEMMMRW